VKSDFGVFINRLSSIHPLPGDDIEFLTRLGQKVIGQARRGDIVRQGEQSPGALIMLSGMACRYKLDGDGQRQIVGFVCPGDLCGIESFLRDNVDHSVMALTTCEMVSVSHQDLRQIHESRPSVSLALWRLLLLEDFIAREWLVNIGKRLALARTAHLICELFYRLRMVGLAVDGTIPWPLTQAEVSDALGLTPIHVNRTFQQLRRLKTIAGGARTLTVLAWEELTQIADFDPEYLWVGGGR
jgi:CRP-like cAMP-binding protein